MAAQTGIIVRLYSGQIALTTRVNRLPNHAVAPFLRDYDYWPSRFHGPVDRERTGKPAMTGA